MSEIFDISETKETQYIYSDPTNPYLSTAVIGPNGARTDYTYKSNGDLDSMDEQSIDDMGDRTTTYTYAEDEDTAPIPDKHRHLLRKIQRPPVRIRKGTPQEAVVTYPPTELKYDPNGNLNEIKDAKGNSTFITYTNDGLVATIEGRNGHVTTFHYQDIANGPYRRLESIDIPTGPPLSTDIRTIKFFYNDADNPDNVTDVEDPLGNTFTMEYDVLDRVTKVIDARDNETEFVYADRVLQEIKLPPNNGSGTALRKISYLYDDFARLQEVKRDTGPSSQETRVKYEYNGFYEVQRLIRIKDTVEKSFSVQRDALGRPILSTDPLGQLSETAWQTSCFGHSQTTPRGIRRITNVNLLCRVSEVRAGLPDTNDDQELDALRESVTYHYDELERLVKTEHADSRYGRAVFGLDRYKVKTRTYHYDELDRLIEMTFEDGSTMFWAYDDEGNVTRMTDPEGKVTEYSYLRDNLLHKVTIKRGDPETVVGEFVYSYDAAGRLETIQYPAPTGITAVFRNAADVSGSGFDANGNLRFLRYEKTGETVPLRSFEWTYDDSNNKQSMLDVDSSRAVRWEYGFDWLDRLVTVKRAHSITGVQNLPATTLQRAYEFDESDNRTFFDDHVNDVTYHYKYKSIDDNGSTRWSDQLEEILIYDVAAGHRNVGDFVSFETYLHDADGNMIKRTLNYPQLSEDETRYGWSDFDRLRHVESDQNGRMQDARYDAEGLRDCKLDKNANSLNEYGVGISTATSAPASSSSSAPSISYIGGHLIMGAEIDGEFVYFLNDALSTVRDLVSYDQDTSEWKVLRSYEFDEYGNALPNSGNGTGPSSTKTFVGGLSVNDDTADSGMFNMGHRNYAAGVLGRFISRDPIGHAGNLNLYAYPTNPVSRVDYEGLQTGSGEKHAVFVGDYPLDPQAWVIVDGPYRSSQPSNCGSDDIPSLYDERNTKNLAEALGVDESTVMMGSMLLGALSFGLGGRGQGSLRHKHPTPKGNIVFTGKIIDKGDSIAVKNLSVLPEFVPDCAGQLVRQVQQGKVNILKGLAESFPNAKTVKIVGERVPTIDIPGLPESFKRKVSKIVDMTVDLDRYR